jgi:hypothetical protein
MAGETINDRVSKIPSATGDDEMIDDRQTSRYVCTKEAPWSEDKGFPVQHPDAQEVGEQEDGWPAGDIITMQCPNCGVRWKEELPQ